MPKNKLNPSGKICGKVLCLGGGRYCLNERAPSIPKWLSGVLLSDIVGTTCPNARAIDEHTRKELKKDSKMIAKALLALGVRKGDHILILDNYYHGICAVYAAARVGAIAIPFQEDASDETLADFIMNREHDTILITNDKDADYAESFCKRTAFKCKCVINIPLKNPVNPAKNSETQLGQKFYQYTQLSRLAKLGRQKLRIPWSSGAPVMLASSSGTSGEAKFFTYNDQNIIMAALASRAASKMPLFQRGEETWLSVVPLQRPYGLLTSTLVPSWGRRHIRFVHADDTVNDLYKEADVISCAADFLAITQRELTITGYDLTKNGDEKPITIIIGGAYVPVNELEVFRTFLHQRGFDATICCGYGTSEACGCISVAVGSTYRPDTVGRLVPGVKVWLRKDDNSPYQLGDVGRLWVAGNNTITTYDDPDLNEGRIWTDDNGERWIDTGDYMSLHQNGYLIFHNSDKDFYFTDTHEKVFPAKAESIIRKINGVQDCWVLGDPDRGCSLAFIAPRKDIDKQKLIHKIQNNIAQLKTSRGEYLTEAEIPRYYKLVQPRDLQLNSAGKRSKKAKDKLTSLIND